MRFFLVFLAACGSSSAPTTSASLSEQSVEQEVASAPAPVEATGCYCPEVTVRCAKPGNFHARADRATCTLDLPPKACKLLGIETGAKASPEMILAAPAPPHAAVDDVFELCSTKHEAHHACDRRMDKPCAFEMDAYDVSLECMSAFATDSKVAHQIEGIRAAREMNACLCAETPCGACAARCRSDHPAFDATCAQAEAVYCQ